MFYDEFTVEFSVIYIKKKIDKKKPFLSCQYYLFKETCQIFKRVGNYSRPDASLQNKYWS